MKLYIYILIFILGAVAQAMPNVGDTRTLEIRIWDVPTNYRKTIINIMTVTEHDAQKDLFTIETKEVNNGVTRTETMKAEKSKIFSDDKFNEYMKTSKNIENVSVLGKTLEACKITSADGNTSMMVANVPFGIVSMITTV